MKTEEATATQLAKGRQQPNQSSDSPTSVSGNPPPLQENPTLSHALFQTLAEATDTAIFIFQGTRFRYVNAAGLALLGYSLQELQALDFWEIIHPDYRASVWGRELLRQQGEQVSVRYEVKLLCKNGVERWVEYTASRIEFDGQPAVLGIAFDTTNRRQTEEALQRAEARSRIISEIVSDYAYVAHLKADGSYAIEWSTKAFTDITGFPLADHSTLDRFDWAGLIHPADTAIIVERLDALLSGKSDVREFRIRTQKLGTRWVREYGKPIWDQEEGRITRLYIAGHDITAQKTAEEELRQSHAQLEQRIAERTTELVTLNTALQEKIAERHKLEAVLREAKERAETSDRFKSEFLALMGHELRTPLQIIMGYTQLLVNQPFGISLTESRETLQRIDRSARELSHLVSSVLEVSRLQMGEFPLVMSTVSLPVLLREVVGEMQEIFRAKNTLRFEQTLNGSVPLLTTDREKVKIVLRNLLHNAAKFTDHGSVQVSVEQSQGGVEIRVKDTGVGIPQDEQQAIFELFRQGNAGARSSRSGVGLGLYIVRRLLELLHGTVAVESSVDTGSTFRVWLPLTIQPSAAS